MQLLSTYAPMWPELVYDRNAPTTELNTTTNRGWVTRSWCPVAASKLAIRTQSDVQSYVNSLIATGNTYHDLGMAWGARMLSPTGMWASENATAPNGKPVSRHLIFMTDGDMVTHPTSITATAMKSSTGACRAARRRPARATS